MVPRIKIVVLILAAASTAAAGAEPRRLPEGMLLGSASASYQVEGAWDEDGKSENIWDHMLHTDPCATLDCSNGDIAADSYHQVERDVEMMRELGLDYYRFSISWPRLLPTSFPDRVNPAAVDYYNRLIDEMLKYNIQPMITVFHWDMPQKLMDMGGWTNPHIVNWFADYARIVFELFGDRTKYWQTINEPREICYQGYGEVSKAPRLNISGVAEYLCAKNLLMAHATAYHIYDQEFRAAQGGQVGIAFSAQRLEPETEADVEGAEAHFQFDVGIYAHPIFSETGNFPQVVIDKIAAKSAEQGFRRSRLPVFTEKEVEFVRGTSDYFGLNHYTTYLIKRDEELLAAYAKPSYHDDIGSVRYQDPSWTFGATPWNAIVPWGFYKLLMQLKSEYNNPAIIITENGFSTPPDAPLDDELRIRYYKEYIDAMLDAVDDGVNVVAYTAWTIMDNFEWMYGYTCQFGLYAVDFTSPARPRTPRLSAFFYKELLRTRTLDLDFTPVRGVMAIDEGH